MSKRKAEFDDTNTAAKRAKRKPSERTIKAYLLEETDSASSDDESLGGVELKGQEAFKINTDYAKRFEHNKKREELHRLEEKYQKPKPAKPQYGDKYDEDSSSSSDEEEDDEGFLATEELDASISKTLQAIRSKDPQVYDASVTFYEPIEDQDLEEGPKAKKEKPMYLVDYHRENLLKGQTGMDDEEDTRQLRTFHEEQDKLKSTIVKEMHAAGEYTSDSDDSDGGFIKRRVKPLQASTERPRSIPAKVEVEMADKDPETFLSNFMAARAWVPGDGARPQPFESEDEEENERAEQFEAAYNLRFEDPMLSKETLRSYARDIIAAKSVRRDDVNSRKKQRDTLREKKDAEKRGREEERARLRRLKVEEVEVKLKKIKKAAGINGKTIKEEEWIKMLEEGWDDTTWGVEMDKCFGDDYYAEVEADSDTGTNGIADGKTSRHRQNVKKPVWDDDIDIRDIIPEFVDENQSNERPAFTLSDSESEDQGQEQGSDGDNAPLYNRSKSSKQHKQDRLDNKRAARLERKKIESLVDNRLDLDITMSKKLPTRFRYRETSPTSFGLTAKDILMAPDASLNEWAGLKKMATFRDAEKKRKDKKRLGKKARLRQWRKETFGFEEGPKLPVEFGGESSKRRAEGGEGVDIVNGKKMKKHKKRSRNKVKGAGETTTA